MCVCGGGILRRINDDVSNYSNIFFKHSVYVLITPDISWLLERTFYPTYLSALISSVHFSLLLLLHSQLKGLPPVLLETF